LINFFSFFSTAKIRIFRQLFSVKKPVSLTVKVLPFSLNSIKMFYS